MLIANEIIGTVHKHNNLTTLHGGFGGGGGWRGILCRELEIVSTLFSRIVSKIWEKRVTYRHFTLITVPCSQRGEVPATASLRPVRKL